ECFAECRVLGDIVAHLRSMPDNSKSPDYICLVSYGVTIGRRTTRIHGLAKPIDIDYYRGQAQTSPRNLGATLSFRKLASENFFPARGTPATGILTILAGYSVTWFATLTSQRGSSTALGSWPVPSISHVESC